MKHLLLAIAVLCITATAAMAQSDTITIRKQFLGTTFVKNGKTLPLRRLEKLLAKDAEAAAEYRKGKDNNLGGFLFSFAGGFLIGYEVGTAAGGGKDINPAVIGAGVGLIGISIPFNIAAKKHIVRAVETYNKHKLKTACLHFEPEFNFAFTGNGIGLRMRF